MVFPHGMTTLNIEHNIEFCSLMTFSHKVMFEKTSKGLLNLTGASVFSQIILKLLSSYAGGGLFGQYKMMPKTLKQWQKPWHMVLILEYSARAIL